MKRLILVLIAVSASLGIAETPKVYISGLQVPVSSGHSLTITLDGKVSTLDVSASGSITYDMLGRVTKAGDFGITYDMLGRINKIGNSGITYDTLGRINKIGDSAITYDMLGRINKIGDSAITYDMLGRVSGIQGHLPEGLRVRFRMLPD